MEDKMDLGEVIIVWFFSIFTVGSLVLFGIITYNTEGFRASPLELIGLSSFIGIMVYIGLHQNEQEKK
jgi:hypothetical protein